MAGKRVKETAAAKATRKRTLERHSDDDTSRTSGSRAKRVRWEADDARDSEEDGQKDEEDDEDVSEKPVMAVSCQFGRVGGAYFDPVTCKIFVLEDSQESTHYQLSKMLLEQADPGVVLVSSKAEDGCIDVLRSHMDSMGGVFQIRPHKDFIPAKGYNRVLSLHLLTDLRVEDADPQTATSPSSDSEPRNAYDFMRRRRDINVDPATQRWNASIRLANYAAVEGTPLCLGSIGALLDHIVRVRAVGELHDQGIGSLEIRGIEYLTLQDVMQINSDALYSLQVFDNETHASTHSDKTKEGLSLFGILNNTRTSLGKTLMREWLLRPSTSLSVINTRHDAVACFIRPENISVASSMQVHLKGVKNVPKILGMMRTGKAQVTDWQGLVKFAFHAVMIRDALSELNNAGSVEVVQKLMEALDVASLKDIGNLVNEAVDWEESTNAARVCIRPHVDEDLDKLKHIYHGIDSVLSKVAERISTNVPADYAPALNVVYFPQLGFLVCVPMREEWQNGGEIEVLEGWRFQFSSESQVYFKSQEMHDLDKHIGDIHSAIVDREIEIIQALLEKILIYDEPMGIACDICAELDCLLSFAHASRAYDYHRPVMSEENVIDIRQGRHPLQELVVDTFVPNDAFVAGQEVSDEFHVCDDEDDESELATIREERNSIVICTGANACGKSVYLKQVALLQYMAQIGCFVPARRATLGIVDKIFTRIQTRESVSRVQSAFMIDLNQVSLALRNATARSLVLLDEFGKGTVSSGSFPLTALCLVIDGAGLFCGLLTHLIARGAQCPKVFAATHFHEVFREDILKINDLPVTCVHMKIMLTSGKGEVLNRDSETQDEDNDMDDDSTEQSMIRPGERITYLYRVGRGLGLNSHAAVCAEIFGVPRRIVQRARYVSHLLSIHELGALLDEEMTAEERVDLEDAEEICRRFLAWDLEASRGGAAGTVKDTLAQVLGRDAADAEVP